MTDSKTMMHEKLDARAVVTLTMLCLIWGLNAVAMKYATEGIAPIFCAGLRSLIATICLIFWMAGRRISFLSAFTFLTPVFATLAGVLLLGEQLTLRLIISLTLVSIGIYIVNRK